MTTDFQAGFDYAHAVVAQTDGKLWRRGSLGSPAVPDEPALYSRWPVNALGGGTGRVAIPIGPCQALSKAGGFSPSEVTSTLARLPIGSFCSQPCLAAAVALATLQRWAAELDGRGRGDEAQAREALGDQLLLLWRRRVGPDPKIVAGAVQLARERDAVDWRRRRG